MREIKFRAWHGYYMKMISSPNVSDNTDAGETSCVNLNIAISGSDYTLMQYTGLKDKNGKEIYEGDILKHYPGFGCEWEERMSVVKFEYCAFRCDYGNFMAVLDDHDQSLEVIGNIYENPELLEQK